MRRRHQIPVKWTALVGSLLAAVILYGCDSGGPHSALDSTRQACGAVGEFYPDIPPGGIYIGVDAATRVVKAFEQTDNTTLKAELPSWKRAERMLAGATEGVTATEGERLLQRLAGQAQAYCDSNLKITPPT
jgi:hypothetical protein